MAALLHSIVVGIEHDRISNLINNFKSNLEKACPECIECKERYIWKKGRQPVNEENILQWFDGYDGLTGWVCGNCVEQCIECEEDFPSSYLEYTGHETITCKDCIKRITEDMDAWEAGTGIYNMLQNTGTYYSSGSDSDSDSDSD